MLIESFVALFSVATVLSVLWLLVRLGAVEHCARCDGQATLVREECVHVGSGWIEAHRTYRCERCKATLQRDLLYSPFDTVG